MTRRAALGAVTAALTAAAPAAARPGPPLLYERAPAPPILSTSKLFPAAPLLVSGTDAYRHGEFVYQDYLFDDHGADTTPGLGASAEWSSQPLFTPAAGDLDYPAGARYRGNAADLVELRIRPTAHAIAYRATLNTVRAPDAAVVGIGIDTDRSGGAEVAWPLGAGISSPGLDEFITAWGTGGTVENLATGTSTPLPAGAVHMNVATHQMTIRVPRSMMDPRTATWRYVAGTGLWGGKAWLVPQSGVSAVFNLGFRFHEPVGSVPRTGLGLEGYTTAPGTGSWFEDGQARDLGNGATTDEYEDVDFGALAHHATRWLHAPGRVQARIYTSSLPFAQGVDHAAFPEFGGALQPYLVTLPADYRLGRRTPVLFALHPSNSGYQTYDVFMPHWAAELGAHRIVVTLLDRGLNGPDGASGQYTGAAESNFFEAWADLRRHFRIDMSRVVLSGYSLGAYADYHLAELWPDLFASVFSVVGTAPTNNRDTELLGNLRWVPVLAWNQVDDALVPYTDWSKTAATMTSLGLRHEQWAFPAGNHLAPALRDDWAPAVPRIGNPVLQRNPWRVDYGYYPSLDDPAAHVRHDHVYWLSGLRLADGKTPSAELARGDVSARSLAAGLGDAPATTYSGTGTSGGATAAISGIRWGAAPHTAARNELDLTLKNLARLTVDGGRAGLTAGTPLTIRVHTDKRVAIVLRMPGRGPSRLDLGAGDPTLTLF